MTLEQAVLLIAVAGGWVPLLVAAVYHQEFAPIGFHLSNGGLVAALVLGTFFLISGIWLTVKSAN
jgi:hypothetical protein